MKTRPEMKSEIERWLAVPHGVANRLAVITTVAAMVIVIAFDEPHPDGGTLLRGRAVILAIVHLLLHWATRHALAVVTAREEALGRAALAAYRDPARISHLDLAAAWFGLFALAPAISG